MKSPLKALPCVWGGRRMWRVSLGVGQAGRRMRFFGKTAGQAEQRARDHLAEVREHGAKLAEVPTHLRMILARWSGKLTAEEMEQALAEFAHRKTFRRRAVECAADYVRAMTGAHGAAPAAAAAGGPGGQGAAGGWSAAHRATVVYRLRLFCTHFSGRTLESITPGEMQEFIRGCGASARNQHKVLRAFCQFCRLHRWIARNPFDEMGSAPVTEGREKRLFAPAEFARLLAAAWRDEAGTVRVRCGIVAALVLGGLAGLRTSEVLRLTWAKLDLRDGTLAVARMKTRKRGLRGRYIELLPAAVAWLRASARELGRVAKTERVVNLSDKNFRDARAAVAKAAGVEWIENGLRRSFGSYHLAAFENGGLTAALMGHTDAETTFAKYRVPVKKTVAVEWFATMPPKRTAGVAKSSP